MELRNYRMIDWCKDGLIELWNDENIEWWNQLIMDWLYYGLVQWLMDKKCEKKKNHFELNLEFPAAKS